MAFVSHRGCIGDMVKDTRDKSCNIHNISKGQIFFLNIRFGELNNNYIQHVCNIFREVIVNYVEL